MGSFWDLDQGFPTCGTHTIGGTWVGVRWYAETFKIKASLYVIKLFSNVWKKNKKPSFVIQKNVNIFNYSNYIWHFIMLCSLFVVRNKKQKNNSSFGGTQKIFWSFSGSRWGKVWNPWPRQTYDNIKPMIKLNLW
jgi:hypothetical protein